MTTPSDGCSEGQSNISDISLDSGLDLKRYVLYQREKHLAKLLSTGQNQSIYQEALNADDKFKKNGGYKLRIFTMLNQIKVTKQIHEGTFGRVFKAYFMDMPVALKVIDATKSKHFTQEKDILFSISSNRIVKTLAAVLDFNLMSPVLVMEHCHCSLKELYSEPVSNHDSARFLVQMTQGLVYLHDKNIIHLDIKPDNLLLKSDGNVVLGDFGFAVQLEKGSEEVKDTLIGTLGYIDFSGLMFKKFGKSSDIFSLACVFVELWTMQKYMVCSMEVIQTFVAETRTDVLKFYVEVFNKGRPRDEDISSRQTLNERINELFLQLHVSKQFLHDLCFKMLDNNSSARPTAIEVLNSSCFTTLRQNFLTEDTCKWTSTPVFNETGCFQISNNYSAANLPEATVRILNSFGFSKISSDFMAYFNLENLNLKPTFHSSSSNLSQETEHNVRRYGNIHGFNNVGNDFNPSVPEEVDKVAKLSQAEPSITMSRCSTIVPPTEYPVASLSTFMKNVYENRRMVGENNILFRPVDHKAHPDHSLEIFWEPITDSHDAQLVLANIQFEIPNQASHLADHNEDSLLPQVTPPVIPEIQITTNSQPVANTSNANLAANQPSGNSNVQIKKKQRGRPRRSFNDLQGITFDGTTNSCTVCGQYRTRDREKARRHRRFHIANGEL